MAILIGAGIWLRLPYLADYGEEFDEGLLLMTARLVADGKPLYSSVFFDSGPVFIVSLVTAFRLLGDSLPVGRGLMLAYAAFAIGGLGWCGRRLYGRGGGLLAALLLSMCPPFAREAGLVLRDIPALGFALLALVMALDYRRCPHCGRAVVAGLAFSLSLLTKSLLFLWFPLLLALLTMPHRGEGYWQVKEIGKTWLVFGLSAALPWLAVCLWVDPLAMVQQNYLYHIAARPAYPVNTPAHNLGLMALYLRDVLPWLPIAGYGALRAIWWPRPLAWAPLVMFLLTVSFLVVQAPLHIHALVALLPPLALLATQGVKETVSSVRQWPSAHIGGWIALLLGIAALLSGMLGLSLWKWPRPVLATAIPDYPPREAIKLLQQAVPTYGQVITDDPMLVYYAGRRAYPWLSDPSIMRMKSGSVSSADLITFTEATGDEFVVATTRFPPSYRDWLAQHYWVDWTQDGLQHLYMGRRRPLSEEDSPAAIFAEGVVLDRVHVVQSQGVAGEWLEVEMVWHSRRSLTTDYTIFIHLLDAEGQLVAQTDRPPLLNLMSTSHWPVEEGIGDRFFLQLPGSLSSGRYRLILGLYGSDTIERLPVVTSPNRSLGDAVVIGEVDVNYNCK